VENKGNSEHIHTDIQTHTHTHTHTHTQNTPHTHTHITCFDSVWVLHSIDYIEINKKYEI